MEEASQTSCFLKALEKMGKTKKDLKNVNYHLVGFAGQTTYPLGVIYFFVVLVEAHKIIKIDLLFIGVHDPSTQHPL